jgi:hypothetical protein
MPLRFEISDHELATKSSQMPKEAQRATSRQGRIAVGEPLAAPLLLRCAALGEVPPPMPYRSRPLIRRRRRSCALLFQRDEQRHGLDQRQVSKCLREVAEVLARGGVDFFGIEQQGPANDSSFWHKV